MGSKYISDGIRFHCYAYGLKGVRGVYGTHRTGHRPLGKLRHPKLFSFSNHFILQMAQFQ